MTTDVSPKRKFELSAPRSFCRMNEVARKAFRFLTSVVNVQAFDDTSQVAADHFVPWDLLEDLMPYFMPTKEFLRGKRDWMRREKENEKAATSTL